MLLSIALDDEQELKLPAELLGASELDVEKLEDDVVDEEEIEGAAVSSAFLFDEAAFDFRLLELIF
jgi:hypothetical protein